MPLSIGRGSGSLKRYYFDRESKRCHEFTYLGTFGNANNFLSADDCQLICQGLPLIYMLESGTRLVGNLLTEHRIFDALHN